MVEFAAREQIQAANVCPRSWKMPVARLRRKVGGSMDTFQARKQGYLALNINMKVLSPFRMHLFLRLSRLYNQSLHFYLRYGFIGILAGAQYPSCAI